MPTTDFYAGAGDGRVNNSNSSTTWATIHDAATGNASSSVATTTNIYATTSAPSTTFTCIRSFFPIDTSGLSDTCTVTAADFVFNINSVANSGTQTPALVQTSQASTSSLVSADFDQCGAISNPTEGATRLTISSTGIKTFSLNSTGLTWISKSDYTKLGVRSGNLDCDNVSPTDGVDEALIIADTSEATGTSTDPYLSVTWSESTTFTPKIIII